MGKTLPKEEEAEGSPRKKALRVDDAAPITGPVASAPSPTGKTPLKGEEAEGGPPKRVPRLDDAALPTAPGASEPNSTGESPPKKKAEGSPPKRSRSPSPRRQDRRPAAAVPLPTVPESSELTVKGAERASDKKRCKCNHVITDSAIVDMTPLLDSKDEWICCDCRDEDDLGIIKTRPKKRDLLICMTCYDHLCYGVGSVAYPSGHSRAHALKKQHWFAVLYCDPERGFCFKCDAKVSMNLKFGAGARQEILDIISRKLLPPSPSVGQTEMEVNPKKVDLADKWPRYESRSSVVQGYAIRGIQNLGNTCYMSAVLQCLSVLGKLRERMLAPDHQRGILHEILKELFVETSGAGDVLDPRKLLTCVGKCKWPFFQDGAMEDSHDSLTALRDIWKEGEEIDNRQSDAPTVIDSIFKFEMARTISCKKCDYSSGPHSEPFLDLKLDFPSKWHPTKSAVSIQTSEGLRSPKMDIPVQLFLADAQKNLEKLKIDIGSEVEETHKPLEVDSTEAIYISPREDVVQSPLQIQEGESVDSLTADSVEYFLLRFSEDHQVQCPICTKEKNVEQTVGSSNEDGVGDAVGIYRFITLPPVLTLHLNRTSYTGNAGGIKISGHVRFMEYLDVKQFMNPSSVDKGSTRYRLAGVIEHIGKGSLKIGHYIAWVRARRLGNQQEGSSCSSSWFCADDSQIRQVILKQVLNREAYILFYEQMEDKDISSIPEELENILNSWELIKSDEIVECNADKEDRGYDELKVEDSSWRRLLYSKYIDYLIDIVDSSQRYIENLEETAEGIQMFGPLIDYLLPFPACSLLLKASSRIAQAGRAGAVMSRTVKELRSIIPLQDKFVVFIISNKAQAIDAIGRWESSGRSKCYHVLMDDCMDENELRAVKKLFDELDAGWLL